MPTLLRLLIVLALLLPFGAVARADSGSPPVETDPPAATPTVPAPPPDLPRSPSLGGSAAEGTAAAVHPAAPATDADPPHSAGPVPAAPPAPAPEAAAAPVPGAEPPHRATVASGEAVLAPKTINAVVVRSWSGCASTSVIWDALNTGWSSYATVPIHVNYNYAGLCSGTITYAALVASGADVVILDDPAGGPEQYSAAEIAALKQYAVAGHGLIGTYALLQSTSADNRGLAPLFGVNDGLSFTTASVAASYNLLQPAHRLFRGLPNPYVSSGYPYTQAPVDGTWDAADLAGGVYVAKTAGNQAAIITYSTAAYRAVYVTSMPEYNGGSQDQRFFYNAITYAGNYAGPNTLNAVVVRSWSGCGMSYSVVWDSLNANWSSYGSRPVYIDYSYPGLCNGPITYAALVASGADVVILSDPAGGNEQYSAAEIAAIKQYADAGHGLIATYLALYNQISGTDNRGLAPLFGLTSSLSFTTASVAASYSLLQPAHRLFRGLPNPYVISGYQSTQAPADGTWDAADLAGGVYVAKTAANQAAIITYGTATYAAAYITSMPEYFGGTEDERLIYNAINYTGTYAGSRGIDAVVVRSWGGCASASLVWDTLNASWHAYGSIPVSIDYSYPGLCSGTITYAALVASGADVVILSDPAGGPQQYSAAEIAALKQYAVAGHGLIGTYALLQSTSADNRGLAPLFGVMSGLSFTTASVGATYNLLQPAHPLFRSLPNPYVSSGYPYSQAPVDGTWDAADLAGGAYLAKTAANQAAIITYGTAAYRAVYITNMPEYGGGVQDRQLLYNAITNQLQKVYLPLLPR